MSTGGVSSDNIIPASPSGNSSPSMVDSESGSSTGFLEGTRFVSGVGRPEMVGESSNQGAVAGSTGSADGNGNINRAGDNSTDPLKGGRRGRRTRHRRHRNSRRRHSRRRHSRRHHSRRHYRMRGGAGLLYSTVPSAADIVDVPIGPRAGIFTVDPISNCGIESETNLGAGVQHSYPTQMGGGNTLTGTANYGFAGGSPELMSDLRGSYAPITAAPYNQPTNCYSSQSGGKRQIRFNQVRRYLSMVCPQIITIYDSFLKKHEHSGNPKMEERLSKIASHYMSGCLSIAANHHNGRTPKQIKRFIKDVKREFSKAGSELRKVEPAAMNAHNILVRQKVERMYSKLHELNTRKRGHSGRHHRKTMRGGYNQWGSNVPNTPSYGLSEGVSPSNSALANPLNITPNLPCDNCTDNYNHYLGSGSESPVLDQANPL